jgi:hypothetical protein
VAVLIIYPPLFGIPQYFVGLRCFLELFFGLFIARVSIGVVFEGKFSVSRL